MPLNIIDSLKGAISSDFLSKAASKFSENEGSIKTAIDKIISTLSERFSNSHSDTGLMNRIANFVRDLGPNKAVHEVGRDCIDNEVTQDKAAPILNNLFGDKFGHICDKIAASSNVKKTTVASLMGTISAMFASHAAKEGANHGQGISGLSSYLKGEMDRCTPHFKTLDLSKKSLQQEAGMHMRRDNAAYKVSDANKDLKRVHKDEQAAKKKSSWGWILLLAIAALLGIFTWRGCKDNITTTADKAVDAIEEGKVIDDAKAMLDSGSVTLQEKWNYLGAEKTLELPNGTTISVPEKGLEAQLLDYLKSSKGLDRNIKFNSDKLTFEVNEAVLDEDAKVQCDNLVAIMKAYPRVSIEIGGYASSSGPEKLNESLSEQRAKAVATYMINEGIQESRIQTKAYGDSNPIASNATQDGRDINQRVSIKILSK